MTARMRGLSLVELMIAMVIGLLILAGVTTAFLTSSRTRQETEKTSQQIENGRYAIQVLTDDLQLAGYLAEFNPRQMIPTDADPENILPVPLPDACATDLPTLRISLPLHVQGYDNGTGAPTCLSDIKPGTDIMVVRRASTCVAGTADCDDLAGSPYFQASLCSPATGGTELAATPTTNGVSTDLTDYAGTFYALDTNVGNLTRRKIDCATVYTAGTRRYLTRIYFIANNDAPGDGVPTLKRAELGATFSIVPAVEGIDNIQLEYGLDTSNPPDGTPDVYTANPSGYNSCSGKACVINWWQVVAIRVNLLARNTVATSGYTDNKTYTLGLKADGSDNSFGPFNDAYKRHAYTTTVRLTNPAGRRQ